MMQYVGHKFFLTNKADALYGSKMVTSRVRIGQILYKYNTVYDISISYLLLFHLIGICINYFETPVPHMPKDIKRYIMYPVYPRVSCICRGMLDLTVPYHCTNIPHQKNVTLQVGRSQNHGPCAAECYLTPLWVTFFYNNIQYFTPQ